ncbi:MAG: hypothetical protein H7Y22_13570 [Gemmatimonadaceae bacterium]|nr:hypothetical protein [Gloeobacterales cyanobacterium ES-bin-141]
MTRSSVFPGRNRHASEEKAYLNTPIAIGTIQLRNRLYRAPALEGAGEKSDPAAIYARHFVPNAQSGIGLIVQGTTIITPEGRSGLGMSVINDRMSMLAFRPVTGAVHAHGARIVLQLGHAGMYAVEDWHRGCARTRLSLPIAPSQPGLMPSIARSFRPVRVLQTGEVEALVERFGKVAAWAREAGYDGIQLASSNCKLLQQFLSSTYNRRDDRYGGTLLRRTTFMREIRAAIAREAGEDFPVLLKYAALEVGFGLTRGGISLAEGIEIGKIAEDTGFAALTPVTTQNLPNSCFSRGDDPRASFENRRMRAQLEQAVGKNLLKYRLGFWLASKRHPFEPVWNREVFAAVKRAVAIPVFAVGGIRTPAEASDILSTGDADLIGLARPFYAEPELAAQFLNEANRHSTLSVRCQNCNLCLVPQLLGAPGVCHNPNLPRAAAWVSRTTTPGPRQVA